jgi:hypothetical protein
MGLIYPSTADFVAVVGKFDSRKLIKTIKRAIIDGSGFPTESLAVSAAISGVDFSDHWSFWQMGYPAVMITDTAFFRNPNYHTGKDTVDTLDFTRMDILLKGLINMTRVLTKSG